MPEGKGTYSVLVVTSGAKSLEMLRAQLPYNQFSPVDSASSCGLARRVLLEREYDIIIINTPLTDDFGLLFARELAEEKNSSILMLVQSEMLEQVTCQVEESGILTLPKPVNRQMLVQAIHMMVAACARMNLLEKQNQSLKKRMEEIHIIQHAKILLMENLRMCENDAHYYLERKAMDQCICRADAAIQIIHIYEKKKEKEE